MSVKLYWGSARQCFNQVAASHFVQTLKICKIPTLDGELYIDLQIILLERVTERNNTVTFCLSCFYLWWKSLRINSRLKTKRSAFYLFQNKYSHVEPQQSDQSRAYSNAIFSVVLRLQCLIKLTIRSHLNILVNNIHFEIKNEIAWYDVGKSHLFNDAVLNSSTTNRKNECNLMMRETSYFCNSLPHSCSIATELVLISLTTPFFLKLKAFFCQVTLITTQRVRPQRALWMCASKPASLPYQSSIHWNKKLSAE